MPLRKINATESTVIAPVAEKTFNSWRLVRFNLVARESGATKVNAILQKGYEDLDGNWEMSRQPEDKVRLEIDDLDAAMAADPSLETVANALLLAVENYAAAQGQQL